MQELHANGTLTDEQYAEGKAVVERKVLAAVSGASDPPIDARTRAPPSPGLAAALALALFVVAGGGYYWIGSPGGLQIAPGAASAASEGAAMAVEGGTGAHPLSVEQISAMIDQLVTSLKSKPEDADGWQMLARSYVAIGKHGQAIGAFKEAARLRPADADLLADYADAWAVTNNRSLKGDPIKLVDRALQLNPANSKALALAGTAAFDRRDYKAAVAYWERLAKVEPAGSTYGEQVRSNIDEARQLAGLPPTTVRATRPDVSSLIPCSRT